MAAETPRPAATQSGARGAPSIISSNLHIVGNLKTEGEIQVDGIIDGDVTAQSLTIGQHARIAGELIADDVVVHGQISGKISARQVRLAKTAKVVGDIVHEVLAIEAGASPGRSGPKLAASDALRKSLRSPSSTAWALPFSTPVRRSFTIW